MTLKINTDTNVSTRTIICDINIEVDCDKMFDILPFHKKIENYQCLLVAMYHKNLTKGDISVFQDKKCGDSFRNAVNLIFRIDEKLINVKVSRHGNFQITGCKKKEHAYECIQYFIELMFLICPSTITINNKNHEIVIFFTTVMTNIVFNIQYKVDKQKLNRLLSKKETKFYNLFETNFGYTGMNIKLPLNDSDKNFRIPSYRFCPDKKEWKKEMIYSEKDEKKKKQKFNTFLVFHSGKIIMSGMCEESMNNHFIYFKDFLQENKSEIQEVIEK